MEHVLTQESLKLFIVLAEDAPNWCGAPPVGMNFKLTAAHRGNLSDLVKKGLITIAFDEGVSWVYFTDAGKRLAESVGHPID